MTPSPTPSRRLPGGRIFWWILGGAAFAFFAIRAWKAGDNDFIAYYHAGARALAGEPLYRTEATPFRYLPFTAFLFAPFSLLEFKLAREIFFALNFAAVVAIYRRLHARVGDLATLAAVVFFFRFHNHDFQNAQVNPLLLALFFAWWGARDRARAWPTFAFAVFASFKLVPFALGLPLLLLGRVREIAAIAAWTIGLNLLPVLFLDSGFGVFGEWFAHAREIEYPAAMLPNVQSLQSALWWLLQADVPARVFAFAMHGLQLALVFACWAACPRPPSERASWILAAALATTVLISPLAWKHNYLQFLPLLSLVLIEDPRFARRRTRAFYALGFLGLTVVPSLVSSWNRHASDRMYLMVWTGLALVFAGLRYSRDVRYSRSRSAV